MIEPEKQTVKIEADSYNIKVGSLEITSPDGLPCHTGIRIDGKQAYNIDRIVLVVDAAKGTSYAIMKVHLFRSEKP